MTSRLMMRIAGVVLVIGAVWYITHLNAEIARLQANQTNAPAAAAAAPARPPAAAPAAPPPAPAAARALTGEQRQAMLEKLGGAGSNQGYPVWFATVPNNPEAASFQKALQAVFEEAGWQIKGNQPVKFAMKPGVYVFAADEDPPLYLSMVNDAFEAAGIPITSGRGYREFVRQKKEETPSWVGLELGADETYVIAVGRAG
jgi:hypothetical protein